MVGHQSADQLHETAAMGHCAPAGDDPAAVMPREPQQRRIEGGGVGSDRSIVCDDMTDASVKRRNEFDACRLRRHL